MLIFRSIRQNLLTFLFCVFLQPLAAQEIFWQHIESPDGANIRSLAVHDDGRAIATTKSGKFYHSIDNGRSWSVLPILSPGGQQFNSEIKHSIVAENGQIFVIGLAGIFVSQDDGQSWPTRVPLAVNTIDYGGPEQPYLLLTSATFEGGVAIYYSESNFLQPYSEGLDLGQQRLGAVAIASDGDHYLVVDHKELWCRNNSRGLIWRMRLKTDYIIYRIIISRQDRIVLATSGGIFEYLPQLNRLDLLTNEAGINIKIRHATTPADGSILAVTASGRFWHLALDSRQWTEHAVYDNSAIAALQQSADGTILIGTSRGVLAKRSSEQNFAEWSHGMQENSRRDLAVSACGDLYLRTEHSLYLSENQGLSWRNTWHPSPVFGFGNRSLTVDDNEVVYLADADRLYYSRDKGGSWQNLGSMGDDIEQVYFREPGLFVVTSAGDIVHLEEFERAGIYRAPKKINHLHFAPGGDIWALTYGGMYISSDKGSTWHFSGITRDTLYTIVEAGDSQWLLSGKNGTWMLSNGGKTWNLLTSNGLRAHSRFKGNFLALSQDRLLLSADGLTWNILDEAGQGDPVYRIFGQEDCLYAFRRSGLYRILGIKTFVNESQQSSRLADKSDFAAFPLVADGQVSFTLKTTGPLSLSMYTMTGSLVAEFNFPFMNAGRHSIPVDPAALTARLYLLKFDSADESFSTLAIKSR